MKRLLLFCALSLALMLACGSKDGKTSGNTGSKSVKVYENEYYSLKYPASWKCDEWISNNEIDSAFAVSDGTRVTFKDGADDAPWHLVMIQKSSLPAIFETPEEWRDLSVSFKEDDDSYLEVIGQGMANGLAVDGWPAATAAFLAINEDGDTIIHKQTVVMVEGQVYYLNNSFPCDDDGGLEALGDFMLNEIKFKTRDE